MTRTPAEVDSDANILFGSALLENMEGKVRVSVVATGIDAESCTGYVAENVQRLHIPRRRTTIETEAPASVPAPQPRMDAPSISRMMDNLAVQLDTLQMTAPASEPVAKRDPAPVIPVPPPKVQMEEPLVLGGADTPIIAEPVSPTMTVRIEPKQGVAPPKRLTRPRNVRGPMPSVRISRSQSIRCSWLRRPAIIPSARCGLRSRPRAA
mgnify:CR=1 FL=1